MKKTFRSIVCVLISVILSLSALATGIVPSLAYIEEIEAEPAADVSTATGVSGSKSASPTELEKTQRETEVTLTLPSAEYQNKIDVVFVMDNSTSTKNSGIDFSKNVEKLLNSIITNNPGVILKIGVVKFRGYATDMIGSGMIQYDGSSKDLILSAVANNTVPGSGSNGHSGLVMAEQMLSADKEVDNDHKYVVFLTDGKNYIWNNAANEPVTIYQQWLKSATAQKNGKPVLNQYGGITQKENGAYPSVYNYIPQITDHQTLIFSEGLDINAYNSAYYTNLYNSTHPDLTGPTKYDFAAYYTKYYPVDSYVGNLTDGDGSITSHPIANTGTDVIPNMAGYKTYYEYVPQDGTFWENVNYLQINPYKVVLNEEDGKYYYDTTQVNEDFFLWHATPLEKGPYVLGHYWKEVIDAKYNTGSIVFYDAGSGTGSHITQSFDQWLVENSDFGAWINEADQVSALFEGIDNSIRYMVSKGTVTDIIPEEFTLVEKETGTFIVKLNGEAQPETKTDDGWVYGTAVDNVYPYEVSYDKNTKTITWKINVPVENANPVSLSYTLEIDEDAAIGYHDTNVSAILDYTSTDETTGTFEFEIPQVEYLFDPITEITVAKTYLIGEGYENAGEEVDPAGLFTDKLSFKIEAYKSFNRETGKTAVPAFDPDTYEIIVGGTLPEGVTDSEVTVTLPEFTADDNGVGDYWYKITEIAGVTAGVTYDAPELYLHLVVVHRGSGVGILQAQIHTTAPNDDGTYENKADDKTNELVNKYSAGSLTVTKKVTGNMGDKKKEFKITVEFTAPEGKTVTGDITYGNSKIEGGWTGNKSVEIVLTDGDKVEFTNIPDGVAYTVTEDDYTGDGYDAPEYEFDNASEDGDAVADGSAAGTISDSADKVTVTNNKDAIIDVGVIVENAPFIIILCIAASAAVLAAVAARKRRDF